MRQLLAAFPDFTIVGECRDGREVLAALDVLKPDVVFLDIQMPEIDGFEVIRRRTPARMPAIVFLTAYDQFAIRAFEAEAHDYLVKPVSEARFAATIKRLVKRLRSGDHGAAPDQPSSCSTARGATVLRLREIDWIEAADNYARIWAGGRSYLLRESLGDLERRVGAHGFARAHRQALVRIGSVRALRMEDRKRGSRTAPQSDCRALMPGRRYPSRAAGARRSRPPSDCNWRRGRVRCLPGSRLFPQSVKQGAEREAFAMWRRVREAQSSQRLGPPEPAHDHQQLDVCPGDVRLIRPPDDVGQLRVGELAQERAPSVDFHAVVRDRRVLDEHLQHPVAPRV